VTNLVEMCHQYLKETGLNRCNYASVDSVITSVEVKVVTDGHFSSEI